MIDGEPFYPLPISVLLQTPVGDNLPHRKLEQINRADREVLEQFITDKLLDAEMREAGIRVTDEDVERYIEEVKKNNRLSDRISIRVGPRRNDSCELQDIG